MTTERQVRDILRHPHEHQWTIQGFGMLRLYLAPDQVERLHIWDADMAVEDVSTVHDHPWDLTSRIVSGRLRNQRYVFDAKYGDPWCSALIKTGEGGHILENREPLLLSRKELEHYEPGDIYHQDAPEIHESLPEAGTVTLVTRTFSRQRDIATVAWRGEAWVSAEPRPATRDEVQHFVDLALARWGQ